MIPLIAAPSGTLGANVIYEYNLASTPGIQILSSPNKDPYGGFDMIPRINGYQYTNAILLGSTAVTRSGGNTGGGIGVGGGGSSGGGYVRGVRYRISVPAGGGPYTMTYAYAMVLENGSHGSNAQPLFSATLITNDSVIDCASPKYFLPTLGDINQQGTDAQLDTALAESEGFFLSPLPSPNMSPNPGLSGQYARDVWAKGWTEVTFDLSPYRGQQVVLNFETDNCVPGGHFAYSYVALRNVCGGLLISGATAVCANDTVTFSVPALTGATYQWTAPGDWSVVSGGDNNIVRVIAGAEAGVITANEINTCANLTAGENVTSSLPTLGGAVSGGTELCTGINAAELTEISNRGGILNWLASTDGVNWRVLPDTASLYTARDLAVTTIYRVLVRNGPMCAVDTSAGATVVVDPLSIGGRVGPSDLAFCLGQNQDMLLQLAEETGNPVNWQSSPDGVNWNGVVPVDTATAYSLLEVDGFFPLPGPCTERGLPGRYELGCNRDFCERSLSAGVGRSGGYYDMLWQRGQSPGDHRYRNKLFLVPCGEPDGSAGRGGGGPALFHSCDGYANGGHRLCA